MKRSKKGVTTPKDRRVWPYRSIFSGISLKDTTHEQTVCKSICQDL